MTQLPPPLRSLTFPRGRGGCLIPPQRHAHHGGAGRVFQAAQFGVLRPRFGQVQRHSLQLRDDERTAQLSLGCRNTRNEPADEVAKYLARARQHVVQNLFSKGVAVRQRPQFAQHAIGFAGADVVKEVIDDRFELLERRLTGTVAEFLVNGLLVALRSASGYGPIFSTGMGWKPSAKAGEPGWSR